VPLLFLHYLWLWLTDYNYFFTVTIRNDQCNIYLPPHLKRVAALPCKMQAVQFYEKFASLHLFSRDEKDANVIHYWF